MAYKISDLREQVEADLSWHMAKCDEVCLKIPSIKSKYCAILYEIEISAKAKELKLNEIYKDLHELYLSGNAGINTIVDRRDVDLYIKGDKRYIKVLADYELEKANAKYVEGVLHAVDSMSFSINAAIKWHIFSQGGA